MTDTTNIWLVGVLCLIAGLIVGFVMHPDTKTVNVPGETVTKTVPVEVIKEVVKIVPTQIDYPALALATVQDKLGDKDSFLTCGDTVYDEDEVTVTKVYDDYTFESIDKSDNEYAVTFTAKFKFTDGSDDAPCRETRTYQVTYEDDEKQKIELK